MKRILLLSLLLSFLITGINGLPAMLTLPDFAGEAAAAESWRTEFEEICRKTSDAMALSKEELKELVARGEKLHAVIETLEETEKKVFLKRLHRCQELFAFVLESKEHEEKK